MEPAIFTPVNDLVLIERDAAETHAGAVELPESQRAPKNTGTVVSVGPKVPSNIRPGDHVLWDHFAGTRPYPHSHHNLVVVASQAIISVLSAPTVPVRRIILNLGAYLKALELPDPSGAQDLLDRLRLDMKGHTDACQACGNRRFILGEPSITAVSPHNVVSVAVERCGSCGFHTFDDEAAVKFALACLSVPYILNTTESSVTVSFTDRHGDLDGIRDILTAQRTPAIQDQVHLEDQAGAVSSV